MNLFQLADHLGEWDVDGMRGGMSVSLYEKWMAYLKWKAKKEDEARKEAERKRGGGGRTRMQM